MQTQIISNKLSDEELISLIIQRNDTLLFEELYDRFESRVYNKCYGFARNSDEAKDMTQDVFLKLYIKLESFAHKSKFSTWFYAFVYNHCVNYVNRDRSRKFESTSLSDNEHRIEDTSIESDTSIFEMKFKRLKKALNKIAPEDKMILLLKYQDYLTIRELTEIYDVGESAIKMRLKRSKDRLILTYNAIS